MFEHLVVRDWNALGASLADDVERIGPFGERPIGRDAFLKFIAGDEQPGSEAGGERPTWDVHRVVYTRDKRSAFARITACATDRQRAAGRANSRLRAR
jgi:hypothetical protein